MSWFPLPDVFQAKFGILLNVKEPSGAKQYPHFIKSIKSRDIALGLSCDICEKPL